jgi:hypothetical protein
MYEAQANDFNTHHTTECNRICFPVTMPFLETVAGEALSMLWGSKMILQVGAIGSLSPLAKVRVLLSSSTEFRFSIQILSTGPSNTSQTCSPATDHSVSSVKTLENILHLDFEPYIKI